MKRKMPQIVQDVNVFIDGIGYLGVSKSLKLPEIVQEMVERKGAVEAKYATGVIKAMEMTFKLSVADKNIFAGFGLNTFKNRVPLLFKASFYADGKSVPLSAAVTGDWESISISEMEGGKEMEVEAKIAVHLYDLNIDGVPAVLVDSENMICTIGGVDYLADLRKNLSE